LLRESGSRPSGSVCAADIFFFESGGSIPCSSQTIQVIIRLAILVRPSSTRSSARAPARWISVAPEHAAPDRPAIFTSSGRTATFHWSTVLGPKRNRSTLPRTRSVQSPGWGRVRELGDSGSDPAPHGRAGVVAGGHELVSSGGAFLERLITIAFEHKLRRPPDVDLPDHALKLHIYGQ
jgi:hypothetical protein